MSTGIAHPSRAHFPPRKSRTGNVLRGQRGEPTLVAFHHHLLNGSHMFFSENVVFDALSEKRPSYPAVRDTPKTPPPDLVDLSSVQDNDRKKPSSRACSSGVNRTCGINSPHDAITRRRSQDTHRQRLDRSI